MQFYGYLALLVNRGDTVVDTAAGKLPVPLGTCARMLRFVYAPARVSVWVAGEISAEIRK
jgi:hypothetical protein